MSLVVFLFGVTVLYVVYLVWTLVPAGTDPQTAGRALARDPRAGVAALILAGLFLAGLALVVTRVGFLAYTRVAEFRHPRPAHKTPVLGFSSCPICSENVPIGGLGRGFRGHMRSEHPDYWRWRRRWSSVITVMLVAWLVALFPLLAFVIVPASRAGETARVLYLFTGYFAIEAVLMIVGGLSGRAARRRFKVQWQEQHPLHARTYGNLKGIKAKLRVSLGRPALASLPLGLLHPATLLLEPIILLFARYSQRKAILDKFEEGRLWFYDRFGILTSLEVKNLSPEKTDSEKITLILKQGSLEIRAENSSNLETVRSAFNAAIIRSTT